MNEQTLLKEFYDRPEIEPVRPYLMGNGESVFHIPGATFASMNRKQPTWNAKDMLYGCERLLAAAAEQETYVFSVYTEEG